MATEETAGVGTYNEIGAPTVFLSVADPNPSLFCRIRNFIPSDSDSVPDPVILQVRYLLIT